MPINYKDYPPEWRAVSKMIRNERAKLRCERCNVRQYGIGYWVEDGFQYAGGNIFYDDFQYTESYTLAREACDHINEWSDGDEPKHIVIVLTVAHQCECKPLCAEPSHLLALCQRCHLRQDAKLHAANSRRTRAEKAGQQWLGDI